MTYRMGMKTWNLIDLFYGSKSGVLLSDNALKHPREKARGLPGAWLELGTATLSHVRNILQSLPVRHTNKYIPLAAVITYALSKSSHYLAHVNGNSILLGQWRLHDAC